MGEQMRGVYPVVETPFHENLDIDYEGLRNVVEFNIECGAAGNAVPEENESGGKQPWSVILRR